MDQALSRVRMISENEGLHLQDDILNEVIKVSKGDMRKCINILQSLYLAVSWDNNLTPGDVSYNGTVNASHKSNKGLVEEPTHHNSKALGKNLTIEDFYRIMGTISPSKIDEILKILLKSSFTEGCSGKIISS
jgi:DNA polymerase III delta prime subunit